MQMPLSHDNQRQQEILPDHSNDVDEELRRVYLALNAVFSVAASDLPEGQANWWSHRQLADRYLTSFQLHSISWLVCDKLLQQENSPSENVLVQQQRRFFAAQTLHTKCCNDIHELPTESLTSLRDSLLGHLKRYSNDSISGDEALKNRLSMCASALAVQMGWTTIVTDLLSAQNNNYHDICMPILRTLPEECASDRLVLINENTRYQMRDHLTSSAPMVFAFLLSHMQTNQESAYETVSKIFFIWIRCVPVHPSALVQTPLLSSAIHGLTQKKYLELAADVVVEVLHMYPSHHYANKELVNLMIPSLSQLPLEEALSSADEDVMRVYCRVVTEMGESYMSLILSTEYNNVSKLVEWVLLCSEISDPEISSITFHFWYRMVYDLEGSEPFDWRQELIDFYTPHLLKLIGLCVKNLMRYPHDVDPDDDDRIDDLKNHRMYVSETIEDCCRLLGGHLVLQQIGSFLKEEVNRLSGKQESEWQGLESSLACIGALHKFVPSDESDVIPFCLRMIPQIPNGSKLLQFTSCQTIGKFAFWLAIHPDLLQPLLPYLSQGLQSSDCAPAASTAINELCKCSNQNFAIAIPVLQLYEDFTNVPGRLALPDELQILEGVCRALSRTIQDSRENGREYLARLSQPIGNRFFTTMSSSSATPKLFIPEIDRLTIIIRFLVLPAVPGEAHPLIEVIKSLWIILETITNRFPHDNMLAEKICRLHKHALRSCGAAAYAPILEPLIQQLVHSFEKTQQSPFLYAASICITEYCQDSSFSQLLYDMVAALAKSVFGFLRTFEELTNHPDVVEEFFYLMGRMMDGCPDQVVSGSLLLSVCQCAVVALELDHQGAQKGTLKFIDSTVSYGLRLREQNKPEYQSALQNVFTHIGHTIVSKLARILIENMAPSNQTPDILWKLSLLCPNLLSQWLATAFDSASSSIAVPERAKSEFISAVDIGLPRDEFNLVVNAFRSACERERRSRRMAEVRSRIL